MTYIQQGELKLKKWVMVILCSLGAVLVLSACGSQTAKTETAASGTEQKEAASTAKVSVKDGIVQMKTHIGEFKKAADNGDQSGAKTHAGKIEESWASFEDEVKEKYKDYYSKVEDPLGIIQSGIKAAPLDKKVLGDASVMLDAVLQELLGKVS